MADRRVQRAALICGIIFPLLLYLPACGSAHETPGSMELGIGTGLDTESLNTHPSFIMVRGVREFAESLGLLWGIEGNFLAIDTEETTYIASVLPFIKMIGAGTGGPLRFFGEVGLGAGLSNHDEVKRAGNWAASSCSQ